MKNLNETNSILLESACYTLFIAHSYYTPSEALIGSKQKCPRKFFEQSEKITYTVYAEIYLGAEMSFTLGVQSMLKYD